MIEITQEKLECLDCPVCGSHMKLQKSSLFFAGKPFIHTFKCSDGHKWGCKIEWTVYGLKVSTE